MEYWITDTNGSGETENGQEYTIGDFSMLMDMLKDSDEEHCDISITHESEWCLSVFKSLKVVWGNLDDEDFEPKYQKLDRVEEVAELWKKLSKGNIVLINKQSWLEGYGN